MHDPDGSRSGKPNRASWDGAVIICHPIAYNLNTADIRRSQPPPPPHLSVPCTAVLDQHRPQQPKKSPLAMSLHPDASQTPKRSRGPVVDEHNNPIMVDGVPLVLSERDSGSTYSQEDRSATMSTYAISDTESHQSDQHNPSPQRGMDTDTLFRHTSYPAAVQDDDDTLLIDIAEDKEIETVHSKSQSEDFKHHDCDCTCSRHFTSCQLVQRLRMPCAQDWAGALRLQYGIDGYKSVKQLAHVPGSILLKQFSDLIRFVEGGKLAHATILAYAIGRVKGRDIFITDEYGVRGSSCACPYD
ncbi:hypothetical protein NMY22_g19781 [Coprinellus aureogranulatus]|nr:hypothetical protein NMY22_g19781 [Coprinellus aureogranulatus]